MKGYKVWVGKDSENSMFKLDLEWDDAIRQLSGLKHLFESGTYKNCGIKEIEVSHCKTCGRVEIKRFLDQNNDECLKCEEQRFDAQRDAQDEDETDE